MFILHRLHDSGFNADPTDAQEFVAIHRHVEPGALGLRSGVGLGRRASAYFLWGKGTEQRIQQHARPATRVDYRLCVGQTSQGIYLDSATQRLLLHTPSQNKARLLHAGNWMLHSKAMLVHHALLFSAARSEAYGEWWTWILL